MAPRVTPSSRSSTATVVPSKPWVAKALRAPASSCSRRLSRYAGLRRGIVLLTRIPYVRYPSTRGGSSTTGAARWAAGVGAGDGRHRRGDRLAGADPHRLRHADRPGLG